MNDLDLAISPLMIIFLPTRFIKDIQNFYAVCLPMKHRGFYLQYIQR